MMSKPKKSEEEEIETERERRESGWVVLDTEFKRGEQN
jgi:hypothetical protein